MEDVCVIGIPNDRTGEKPKGSYAFNCNEIRSKSLTKQRNALTFLAFIALSPSARVDVANDASKSELIVQSIKDFVKEKKIYYKHLAEVEFIDHIPKTASGKLLRKDRTSVCFNPGKCLERLLTNTLINFSADASRPTCEAKAGKVIGQGR